ncbi:putative Pancreatic lipase-related protein 2 [Daphnia magna]|uniref:Putative Pancreatic lipase-related protein 2 n=1 Tax=Daphnia magna TaxID=35525 RepID=A0A164LYT8_9CRUS|nr:putative Pancreatic lipase-related protein 2 [Daphnia magna]
MPAMKTHFLLWTRRNPKIFEELLIGDVLSLTLSNYVRTNPTRIYVHGWTENGQNKLSRNLRDGRLLRFKKKRINRISN